MSNPDNVDRFAWSHNLDLRIAAWFGNLNCIMQCKVVTAARAGHLELLRRYVYYFPLPHRHDHQWCYPTFDEVRDEDVGVAGRDLEKIIRLATLDGLPMKPDNPRAYWDDDEVERYHRLGSRAAMRREDERDERNYRDECWRETCAEWFTEDAG